MADKPEKSGKVEKSDFDFKSLIWDGAKSLGTSAVTSLAEWGAAWALNKVGIQVGFEKRNAEKQALTDELKQIDGELHCIEQNLSVIQDEIQSLEYEIAQLGSEISMDVNQGNLSVYTNTIDNVWSSLTSAVNVTANPDEPGSVSSSDITTLQTSSDQVGRALSGIVELLCDNPSSGNLLDQWTNSMIQNSFGPALADGTANVPNYNTAFAQLYAYIERNFLNTVHTLFKGYTYMLSYNIAEPAYAKLEGGGIDLSQPLSSSQKSEIAQKITQNQIANGDGYMDQTIAPALEQIGDYFLYSVQRLLLSQYRRSTGSHFIDYQSPYADPDMASRDEVFETILARATLLRGLICGNELGVTLPDGSTMPSLGIAQTSYLRPSQISAGAGPSVDPGGDLDSSTGTLLTPPSTSSQPWNKVIDTLSDGTIASYADSDIQIVAYNWPSTPLDPGTPTGTNAPFSTLDAKFYNKFTLETVDNPQQEDMPNLVLFAHCNDRIAIENAGKLELSDLQWTFTGEDSSFFKVEHIQNNPPLNDTYVGIQASLTVEQESIPSDKTQYAQTASVSFTFADARSQPARPLLLAINGNVSVEITNITHSLSEAVPMTTSADVRVSRGSTAFSDTPYGPYQHPGGNDTLTKEEGLPSMVTTPSADYVQPGDSYSIDLMLYQFAEPQGAGIPNSSNSVRGTASIQLHDLTIAWEQPKPS